MLWPYKGSKLSIVLPHEYDYDKALAPFWSILLILERWRISLTHHHHHQQQQQPPQLSEKSTYNVFSLLVFQVAARLAGRATAEDLPVPLPAAVLVQVAGMPCASGIRYSPWKWAAGTWKYTSWKRKSIIHPPPFLGFEMLVLGGCIGLITWIEWKERETYRLVVCYPLLTWENDGKWIQFEKTTYFLIGLKLENTK